MSSAWVRYRLVTPNRPEATCLIALRRRGSSEPVGVLAALAGVRLARRSSSSRWRASRAPPARSSRTTSRPVENRFTIDSTGSTSSIGTGGRAPSLKPEQPAQRHQPRPTARRPAGCTPGRRRTGGRGSRAAAGTPSRGRTGAARPRGATGTRRRPRAGGAGRGRRRPGRPSRAGRRPPSASTSRPMPPSWEVVPVKYRSTRSCAEPDRLEDLGAAVGRDRRDAHLAHHLEHALAERLDQVRDRLLRRRPR